ncbi:MAG: glycosyltransferase family 39 protein [bacterium]
MDTNGYNTQNTQKAISYQLNKYSKIFIILIVLFGLALRLVFFSGYVQGDDKHYMGQAYRFSIGDFTPGDNQWGVRLGMVIPTALSFFLFGVSDISLVLFSLICSLGNIILIYYFGKMIFNERIALLSAFLMAFFPLEVIYASHLFPCVSFTFFTGLGIFCFLKGEKDNKWIYYLLSGLFIGIGYLIRENALFLALPLVIYMLYNKKIKIEFIHLLVGFFIIIALESGFYYFQNGDILHRSHVVNSIINKNCLQNENFKIDLNWFLSPLAVLFVNQEFGFFYYLILPIGIFFLYKKNKAVMLLLIWIFPLLLYTFYGPISASNYWTLTREPRYLAYITIPSLLILSYFLDKQVNKKWMYSLLIFLLISSIGFTCLDDSKNITFQTKKLYGFHKMNPEKTLIVVRPLFLDLLFYSRFQPMPSLKLFAIDEDKSATLKSIKKIYPNVDIFHDLKSIDRCKLNDVYIAVDNSVSYYSKEILKSKKKREIITIQRPRGLYFNLFELKRKLLTNKKILESDLQRVYSDVQIFYFP